jgi:hypothetical protein
MRTANRKPRANHAQTTRKQRAARTRTTRAHEAEAARNRLLRFNPAQQLRHLAMLMQDRRIGLQ